MKIYIVRILSFFYCNILCIFYKISDYLNQILISSIFLKKIFLKDTILCK